jgi:hypothetical protein
VDAWLEARQNGQHTFSRAMVLRRYHHRVGLWDNVVFRWRLLRVRCHGNTQLVMLVSCIPWQPCDPCDVDIVYCLAGFLGWQDIRPCCRAANSMNRCNIRYTIRYTGLRCLIEQLSLASGVDRFQTPA